MGEHLLIEPIKAGGNGLGQGRVSLLEAVPVPGLQGHPHCRLQILLQLSTVQNHQLSLVQLPGLVSPHQLRGLQQP